MDGSGVSLDELATEIGVEKDAVIAKLEELGESALSSSSVIDAPMARRLREAFKPQVTSKPSRSMTIPVTIYILDESIHAEVEAAVEALLLSAGIRIESREEPIQGSWRRNLRAILTDDGESAAAREAAAVKAHAADTRKMLARDAKYTATLLKNLGPVIASLQPTKDAVIRAGALLIVKVDWMVSVHQLTARQQFVLDHQPELVTLPHKILFDLGLTQDEGDGSKKFDSVPELSRAEPLRWR